MLVALQDGLVVAGCIYFLTKRVWHAQYIAASELGHEISALDTLFSHSIQIAKNDGSRYFDFGTSNENNGWILNDGLYRYKHEFGGGGVVHEFFEIDLEK